MKASLFAFVESVEAENIGHALRLSYGPTGGENGDHSAANFDVLCAAKGFKRQLRKVGAKAHFAFPMGDHWFVV